MPTRKAFSRDSDPIEFVSRVQTAFTMVAIGSIVVVVVNTTMPLFVGQPILIDNGSQVGAFRISAIDDNANTVRLTALSCSGQAPTGATFAAGLALVYSAVLPRLTGRSTLVAGAGPAIALPTITANAIITYGRTPGGGTPNTISVTITPGTGFAFNSQGSTDTGTVLYEVASL